MYKCTKNPFFKESNNTEIIAKYKYKYKYCPKTSCFVVARFIRIEWTHWHQFFIVYFKIYCLLFDHKLFSFYHLFPFYIKEKKLKNFMWKMKVSYLRGSYFVVNYCFTMCTLARTQWFLLVPISSPHFEECMFITLTNDNKESITYQTKK